MSDATGNTPGTFCRMLDHGLAWNNNVDHFSVAPCCYFSKTYRIDTEIDVASQLLDHQNTWRQEDFAEVCRQCLDQERAGETSYRESSFDTVSQDAQGITFVTVAVNKQCNLACASCGPEASSYWYQQNRRDAVVQSPAIHRMHQQGRDRGYQQQFVDIFSDASLHGVTYIKFGGGEPLMSSVHEKILRNIPDPGAVTVQYTSNFSFVPSDEVLDLWQRFRLVKWCASIDGIDQQFEILRWPHRWHDLANMVSNMPLLVPHNVMFGVEHTLNPLNAWYYDRFQHWFQNALSKNRYGDPSDLNLHRCLGHLDLAQTPPALRHDLSRRLGKQSAVVKFLEQYPYRGDHHDMVAWMDQLDQRRGTEWRQVFAEVAHYFA